MVKSIPQAQLRRDSSCKPMRHVEFVGTLGGGRQAKQHTWFEVLQQAPVRRRRRVVELVNDEHFVEVGIHIAEIHIAQRLYGCKNVVTLHRSLAADHQLTEGWIAERLERCRGFVPESRVGARRTAASTGLDLDTGGGSAMRRVPSCRC